MPTAPPTHRSHPPAVRRNSRDRGYTTEWNKASAAHLRASPICRYCGEPATLVDHLYPHRGDQTIFWNRMYWVSSCARCHSSFKQSIERKGRAALDALALRLGLQPKGRGA
jgi:5-methylcytosine-specific restriction protein A